VITATGRKPGSIERKVQNVSAVPDEIGIPWIRGYKPLPHYQDVLVAVVEQQVISHPELFVAAGSGPPRARDEDEILVAPPAFLNSDPERRPAAIRRSASSIQLPGTPASS
jgi:hypothetical protein